MVRKSKKNSSTISIDLSETESSGVLPEGDYVVEVVKIEQKEGQRAPYLNWELKVTEGKHKGKKVWNMTSLSAASLWNLRANLEALGYEIPTGAFDLDTEDLIGLEMGVSVEHETYNNKKKAKITDVYKLEEDEDEDDEDEEEDDDSDEEEDDEEEDEDEDEDESEDEDEDDEESEDEDEDDEDEDEDEEDEEEEEEPPKKKSKSKKGKRGNK